MPEQGLKPVWSRVVILSAWVAPRYQRGEQAKESTRKRTADNLKFMEKLEVPAMALTERAQTCFDTVQADAGAKCHMMTP